MRNFVCQLMCGFGIGKAHCTNYTGVHKPGSKGRKVYFCTENQPMPVLVFRLQRKDWVPEDGQQCMLSVAGQRITGRVRRDAAGQMLVFPRWTAEHTVIRVSDVKVLLSDVGWFDTMHKLYDNSGWCLVPSDEEDIYTAAVTLKRMPDGKWQANADEDDVHVTVTHRRWPAAVTRVREKHTDAYIAAMDELNRRRTDYTLP